MKHRHNRYRGKPSNETSKDKNCNTQAFFLGGIGLATAEEILFNKMQQWKGSKLNTEWKN